MPRAEIAGPALAYDVAGQGEPVVLIHGALIADEFRPLLAEPVLTDRYQLIAYHRPGYAGSTHPPDPVGLAQQATDCRVLLRHLGVPRAHVVGHSYGGAIALQLALDFPDSVQTLVLLEPALFAGNTAQPYRDALERSEQRFSEAGAEIAIDEFFRPRCGAGWRATVDRVLPEAYAQAVADAAVWFERESPALRRWICGEAELRRIRQPVLAVLGGESDALSPRFRETYRLLLTTLPHAEGYILPGATHLLHIQNPREMAEALAAFLARYPMPTAPYPERRPKE